MLFLFSWLAHIEAFLKRGELCIHPGRTFKKGKILCSKCKKQLGTY